MDLLRVAKSRPIKMLLSQNRNIHLLMKQAYIDGQWVNSNKNKVFEVQNPADDKVIAKIPDLEAEEATKAIKSAEEAFKLWRDTTARERSSYLKKLYEICSQNSSELAEIITAEAGKPLSESKGEVNYGNSFLEWFSEAARHVNGEILSSPWPNKVVMVTRQPVGVVSVITPWNFPFAMITRKVAALVAAGCTCVIKPAEDTPLTALAFARLAEEAGIPKGVINVVPCSRENAPAVGKVLCEHPSVSCISFTGSTHVGKIIYGMAAKGIKKVGLELGGNAPFIVFPSADLDNALKQAMIAKFRNNGQSCVGVNRFYIHESIYDSFVEGLKSKIQKECVLGPTNKDGVTSGPLVNLAQIQKVESLVNDAVNKGAKVVTGGKVDTSLGNKYYEPTLLTNLKQDMNIVTEEIFGPVAQCFKFSTEEEVIQVANNTTSGLASYIFTEDLGQAFRVSKALEYGMVGVNDGLVSASEVPFGGIKESGIGREGGMHGIEEYTEIKYTLMSNLQKK